MNLNKPNFKPLERLHNVEFTRDWGLPLQVTQAALNEALITGGVQLADIKNNSIRYQFTNYQRGTDFNGIRNDLMQSQLIKGWRFDNSISLSNVKRGRPAGLLPSTDLLHHSPLCQVEELFG